MNIFKWSEVAQYESDVLSNTLERDNKSIKNIVFKISANIEICTIIFLAIPFIVSIYIFGVFNYIFNRLSKKEKIELIK